MKITKNLISWVVFGLILCLVFTIMYTTVAYPGCSTQRVIGAVVLGLIMGTAFGLAGRYVVITASSSLYKLYVREGKRYIVNTSCPVAYEYNRDNGYAFVTFGTLSQCVNHETSPNHSTIIIN